MYLVLNTDLNICALNYKFIPTVVHNGCYMHGSESGSTFSQLFQVGLEKNLISLSEIKLFPFGGIWS
jgi:hypothetical protein